MPLFLVFSTMTVLNLNIFRTLYHMILLQDMNNGIGAPSFLTEK